MITKQKKKRKVKEKKRQKSCSLCCRTEKRSPPLLSFNLQSVALYLTGETKTYCHNSQRKTIAYSVCVTRYKKIKITKNWDTEVLKMRYWNSMKKVLIWSKSYRRDFPLGDNDWKQQKNKQQGNCQQRTCPQTQKWSNGHHHRSPQNRAASHLMIAFVRFFVPLVVLFVQYFSHSISSRWRYSKSLTIWNLSFIYVFVLPFLNTSFLQTVTAPRYAYVGFWLDVCRGYCSIRFGTHSTRSNIATHLCSLYIGT